LGSLGGPQFQGPRLGGGFDEGHRRFGEGHHHFDEGHHRFRGAFLGGAYGYFPSYDDYSYADFGDYNDNGACFQYRHIHTAAGWRWRQVWVCN
jgi:hypothetical protein